jgi:hypothetical protein
MVRQSRHGQFAGTGVRGDGGEAYGVAGLYVLEG